MIVWFSDLLIPFLISYLIGFGLLAGRPVFDDFLKGAKAGLKTVTEIVPTLIGLMTAVGVLRSSGFLEALGHWLEAPAARLGIPQELVSITLVRLISNSAALGLVLDLFKQMGPDSPVGMAASVLMSSTETVFYCISIYFGSVRITKMRYTLVGGFLATAVGLAVSLLLTL